MISEIAASSDTKNLEDIFLRLQEVKNDTEQRNWTVHDDEEMIISLLTRLNDSLQTCDRNVSLYVILKGQIGTRPSIYLHIIIMYIIFSEYPFLKKLYSICFPCRMLEFWQLSHTFLIQSIC